MWWWQKRNVLPKSGFGGWTAAFQNSAPKIVTNRKMLKIHCIFTEISFRAINRMCFSSHKENNLKSFCLSIKSVTYCMPENFFTYALSVVWRKYNYFHLKTGLAGTVYWQNSSKSVWVPVLIIGFVNLSQKFLYYSSVGKASCFRISDNNSINLVISKNVFKTDYLCLNADLVCISGITKIQWAVFLKPPKQNTSLFLSESIDHFHQTII